MKLTEENFLLYAANKYDMSKVASIEEFKEDIKRFQYLKRLFHRYEEDNNLRVRLILNHLIVLYNCFGTNATELLFHKLENYHTYLKPFLEFLSYLPDYVEYNERLISTKEIKTDFRIVEELRKL